MRGRTRSCFYSCSCCFQKLIFICIPVRSAGGGLHDLHVLHGQNPSQNLCYSWHSRSLSLPTSPWVVGARRGRLRVSALKNLNALVASVHFPLWCYNSAADGKKLTLDSADKSDVVSFAKQHDAKELGTLRLLLSARGATIRLPRSIATGRVRVSASGADRSRPAPVVTTARPGSM